MTQHPITPSDELIGEWIDTDEGGPNVISRIATRAAQWGADQELEACLNWLTDRERFPVGHEAIEELRAARRSKPPSLKEQALKALENLNGDCLLEGFECPEKVATIRLALEQLDD